MAKSSNRTLLTRREALFLSATAGMGIAAGPSALASDSIKTGVHQEPGGISTPRSAIANTQYGKVRGFLAGGVFTFKGVPYGQTTAGQNRWLPAKPPTPWKDEYPALIYGANCPQNLHTWTSTEQTFIQDWDDGWQSEDMLKLNIWTPSLTGKRPVMFYIHGGGYSFGSSYELPSHEGAQMARHHDVVQVSVNHRLNILGFFDVSEIGGSAYEDSVNVGMTDLVAALQWVQENIANFGGDPDRVMIYGQSGGGSKVTTLMGMPSAAGLIPSRLGAVGWRRQHSHQRTADGSRPPDDEGSRAGSKRHRLAPEDGVGEADRRRQCSRCQDQSAGTALMGPGAPGPPRVGWSPCVDGKVINMRSFFDAAPEVSKNVPMLIGSVSEEGNHMSSRPPKSSGMQTSPKPTATKGNRNRRRSEEDLSEEGRFRRCRTCAAARRIERPLHAEQRGEDGQVEARPEGCASLRVLLHVANADPGRIPGAWHTAELQFCFDNTKRCEQGTGQHARGAGAGEEDGSVVGDLRRNRESERAGRDLGSNRSGHQQDDDLG